MAVEIDLLARAQAGEEEAFASLVRRYEGRLRAYARGMVRHDQDAEDLTQEALIRIYRSLPYFQRQSSFSTWAYRILNHLCLDHLRRTRREPHREISQADAEAQPELPDAAPGPEDLILRSELREYLRSLLDKLPVEQRAVVVLHDVCSLKYREIAEINRCSIGTVKSRLFTARMRLREMMGIGGTKGGER